MRRLALVIVLVFAFAMYGCPQEDPGDGGDLWGGGAQCNDTDGGKNEFEKGIVSVEDGLGTDKCLGGGESVLEYYCENGELESEDIACPAGFVCDNGACIVIPCYDTEDDADAGTAGTVSYNGVQYADTCIDENWVNEFSCNGGVFEEAIRCADGERCENGECVTVLPCVDSDGGQDVYEAGQTSLGGAIYEDICVSYNVVFEYYCENGSVTSMQIMCPDGEECSGGVCVEGEERECRDTDNGKSRYKRGTVTYWVGAEKLSETDKCYDQDSVLEVWCTDEGSVGFGILECYDSDWCEDGACTSGS
jgi:hypothetical protein